jgi:hypothetical protein
MARATASFYFSVSIFTISFFMGGCTSKASSERATMSSTLRVTWEATQSRRTELLGKVKQVQSGMTAEEVLALLGKPTYDYVVGPKSPDAPQNFHRIFRYLLKEFNGGGNSSDEYIYVIFDNNQKVQSIAVIPPGIAH